MLSPRSGRCRGRSVRRPAEAADVGLPGGGGSSATRSKRAPLRQRLTGVPDAWASRPSDNDRLGDGNETNRFRTDPLDRDTDNDRLRDRTEVKGFFNKAFDRVFKSNPLVKDTDRDGLRDKVEVTGARNDRFRNEPTNPRDKDTDGGGVDDLREIRAGSNPADNTSGPRNP